MKKAKQATTQPNKSPDKNDASPIPAKGTKRGTPVTQCPKDGTPVFTSQDPIYRVEPDHAELWEFMHTQRAMRKAPDIEAVARLGGLPASVKPYELAYRSKDGSLFPTCYGESTATVTRSLTFGFGKVVDAARGVQAQYADADSSEIRDGVKHLGWVDEKWIEKNILHSARSSAELGAELTDMAIGGIPEVVRWGSAPPTPAETVEPAKEAISPVNKFLKVSETWEIAFEGETCRIPASLIGLDYISELLRCAGKTINALKLRQISSSSVPTNPGTLEELRSNLDPEKGDDLQDEWGLQPVLDEKARAEYEDKLKELKEKIAFAKDTNNCAEVSTLAEEAGAVAAELRKQTKKTGRGHQFPNQQESARSTVSHAIRRALGEIEKYSPTTALHLRKNIVAGRILTYRDPSVRWKT